MLPLPAWIAILKGPRVPSSDTGRDLMFEHLAWARRAPAAPPPTPAAEENEPAALETPCCWPEAGDADAQAPLGPDEVREAVTAAAVELSRVWRDDVLAGVPSQFIIALCGLADRGAYLLEEAAPDLAAGFARSRDLFVGHSQGGVRLPDDALLAAFDELEALADATVRRAIELNGHEVQ